MRVLEINVVYGTGSTGRIVSGIKEVIEKHGDTCWTAYGRGMACGDIKIGTSFEIAVHGAITRLFDCHGYGSIKATKKLIDQIKEIHPDIIHIHNVHGYYINFPILFQFLREWDKPIMWTLHDCWSFTGHCAHFSYKKCMKWKTACEDCPEKKSYPQSILCDRSKKNFLKKRKCFTSQQNMEIVVPSVWLQNLVSQSFLNKYPITVIPTGIDLAKFNYTAKLSKYLNTVKEKRIVLGVANVWTERKGLYFFEELADKLGQKYQVVLVGEGSEQVKSNRILGIGKTDSIEELAELYSSSYVYVNLTLEDTFPTTNLEALACGTPIITFDTGGSKESLDESCGYVVSQGDTDAVANLISSGAIEKITREACRKKAEKYNKEDKFECYYKKLRSMY